LRIQIVKVKSAQFLGLVLVVMKFTKIRNLFISLPTPLGEHAPKSKPGRPGCKMDTKLTIWKNNDEVQKAGKKDTDTVIGRILKNGGTL